MKIRILEPSVEELNDAILNYENQQIGLGLRLKEEVDNHVKWIVNNPTVPHIRRGGYRRVNLSVFPYFIAYIVRHKIVWILAIGNSYKTPEYWIRRMGQVK